MSASISADDLYTFIGLTFERSFGDEKIAPKLSNLDGIIKVITTDPAGVLVMDLSNHRAGQGQADDAADATLRMSGEMANRFWQGDVNLLAAVNDKSIGLEGKMATLATALPAAKHMFPVYVEVLKSAGRDDLLI